MNIIKSVFVSVVVCLFCMSAAYPQQTEIKGTVVDDADGKPVAGVIVELLDESGKMLGYGMSSGDGGFTVKSSSGASGDRLRLSCMSYRQQVVLLAGKALPLSVRMVPDPTLIREIEFKAPNIMAKGDTLVFNVERYADVSDRSIEDVLKKMPGIEIAESGQISYQGEPINNFYIEGNDMLDGRYNLATKNISHKDVMNVELMENHQPVRALQDIVHSDRAAINLKLQEEAKSRWVWALNAGGGYAPALYDGSLFGMRIGTGVQSMQNLKINNTGKNLATENTRFGTFDVFSESTTRALSPQLISSDAVKAPIDEARTRFNRSLLANTLNSYKLNPDYQMDAEVSYHGERLTSASNTSINYFDAGIDDFHEAKDVLSHIHELSARVTAKANKPEFFLKNDLNAAVTWKDVTSRISGISNVRQEADLPSRHFSNHFQLIKRTGKRTFTVTSDNRYQTSPASLEVDRNGSGVWQDAKYSVFNSETNIQYGFNAGRWRLSSRAGVVFRYNTLDSELGGLSIAGLNYVNDLSFFQTRTYVTPSAVYEKRRSRLSIYMPITLRTYSFNDKTASGGRSSKQKVTVDPSVLFRHEITARLIFTANARYSSSAVNERIFFPGAIMSDYRNITVGHTMYDDGSLRAAGAGLQFRNPVTSWFANANVSYSNSDIVPLAVRNFIGDYVINTYSSFKGSAGTWFATAGFSKGLGYGRMTIGMDASVTLTESAMLLENVKTPYRSENYSLSPRFKGRLTSWWNADYTLTAGRNVLELKNGSDKSDYYSASQALSFNFSIIKGLLLNTRTDHYFTDLTGNGDRNLVLVDAGIKWKTTERVELSAYASNLLNRNKFSYTSLGSLSASETAYAIRKRSVVLSAYVTF